MRHKEQALLSQPFEQNRSNSCLTGVGKHEVMLVEYLGKHLLPNKYLMHVCAGLKAGAMLNILFVFI